MANNNKKGGGKRSDASIEARRRLLRTVTVGGTALGVTALPGKWAKPIVSSVILPAHGQTSPGTTCCPEGLTRDGTSLGSGTTTVNVTNVPNGISYDGTFLDGTANEPLKYSILGECPPESGCGGTAVQYAGKYQSFNGEGGKYASYVLGIRCGDYPLFRKYFDFEGTRVGASDGTITYTATASLDTQICKYFFENNRALSGAVEGLQRRSRGRRFQFGD